MKPARGARNVTLDLVLHERARLRQPCKIGPNLAVNGYSRTWTPMVAGRRKPIYTHRKVMAAIHGWDALEGKQVNHHCDNRGCINPEHLYIGTQADNVTDMIQRGRARMNERRNDPGERNSNAKLTNDQVAEIRHLWQERLVATQRELAEQFGVHPSNISLIVRGRSRREG